MPLPLNHNTNRFSMGAGDAAAGPAYAVPVELNMATSGGRPTVIADPDKVSPRRNRRRETLLRFVITCDMCILPFARKLPRANQRQDQFFKTKIRILEVLENPVERGSVGRCFHAARGIAEILFYHALLALRRRRQNGSQFARRAECRIGDPYNRPFGVDRQNHRFGLLAPPSAPAPTRAPAE